ncbi:MAG TPA: hypothetical protein VJP04_09685 [Terriglobales bacterium]|nr:hypothetical protein [Terriglobales bacterium]
METLIPATEVAGYFQSVRTGRHNLSNLKSRKAGQVAEIRLVVFAHPNGFVCLAGRHR